MLVVHIISNKRTALCFLLKHFTRLKHTYENNIQNKKLQELERGYNGMYTNNFSMALRRESDPKHHTSAVLNTTGITFPHVHPLFHA